MTLEEIKAFLTENKDKEDVKGFLNTLNPLSGLTKETVADFIEKNDILKSFRDSFVTKSIEAWKTNNVQKMIDEEIKKKFPEADPKDLEVKKLRDEMDLIKKEKEVLERKTKLKELAKSMNLDESIVDLDLSDEEKAKISFEKLSGVFENVKKNAVDEVIKTGVRAPHGSTTPPADEKQTPEQFYGGMFK
jgi:hypothetical protein